MIVGLQLLLGVGLVLLFLVVLLVVCWCLFVVRFGLFVMMFRDLLIMLLLCFGVYVYFSLVTVVLFCLVV